MDHFTQTTTSVVKIKEHKMRTLRNICQRAVLAAMVFMPLGSYGSVVNDKDSIETISVELKGLSICHQREWRNMSVNLDYA
jgi:hypothetical protein